MKIMAFLQNQWFKNPERVEAMIKAHPESYERYIACFLFMGCKTGRMLKAAFGEDLYGEIVWCEASPKIGGHSSSAFPADPAHMARMIEKHKPEVILTFGKIAMNGILELADRRHNYFKAETVKFNIIHGPHPAARNPDTIEQLQRMATDLRAAMKCAA